MIEVPKPRSPQPQKKKEQRERVIYQKETFKEASSFNPISTDSMLSIFPSPVRSLISGTRLLLLSGSRSPGKCKRHNGMG